MKRAILILIALAFLFVSCEKEDNDSNNSQNDPEYFPNEIGYQWKYERCYGFSNEIDTVTVEITGDTIEAGNTYKIWVYTYSGGGYNRYILEQNDSIMIYDSDLLFIKQMYIIPFELNLGWRNPNSYSDSTNVVGLIDTTIYGIHYSDMVHLYRFQNITNYYGTENIYFKPHLGIVRLDKYVLDFGYEYNESWKLIETNVE